MFDHLQNGFFEFSGQRPEAVSLPEAAEAYLPRVITRIGYDPATVSQSIIDKVETIIQTGLAEVSLGGLGRMTPVDAGDTERITGRGVIVESSHWAHVVSRMSSVRQMVCLALTLGDKLDRAKSGAELFESYVLDAFGSEMIEQAADRIEQVLTEWYASVGLKCTRRFSPGYCDWPLASGQKEIFSFLKPAGIGISILETGTMMPSKSVSAVMIAADGVPLVVPCRFCDNRDCDHRRV